MGRQQEALSSKERALFPSSRWVPCSILLSWYSIFWKNYRRWQHIWAEKLSIMTIPSLNGLTGRSGRYQNATWSSGWSTKEINRETSWFSCFHNCLSLDSSSFMGKCFKIWLVFCISTQGQIQIVLFVFSPWRWRRPILASACSFQRLPPHSSFGISHSTSHICKSAIIAEQRRAR